MKKIISIIICLCSLMQFECVFAEDTSPKPYEQAATVLDMLGIMPLPDDGVFREDEYVTRGEMAVYAARALGYDEFAETDKFYFADVSSSDWCRASVNQLFEKDIVTIGTDRKYRPNDNITFNEACCMLSRMIGYERFAQNNGGYAWGYVLAAKKAGIIDSFVINGATRGDIAVMLYNTLCADMYTLTFTGSNGYLTVEEGNNLFLKVWGIEIVEGVVTAIHGASVTDGVNVVEGTIVIGDEYFDTDMENPYDYLGCTVRALYTEDDDINTIVYMEKIEKKNEELVISSENIVDYDNYRISYYESVNYSRVKSAKITTDAVILYNQGALESKVIETINGLKNGNVILRDTDGDGDFDLVLIKEYKDFVAGYINDTKLYNKNDVSDIIELEDYSIANIKNSDGVAQSAEKITAGSLLSVAASNDKSVIEIIICQNTVKGTVNAINESENIIKIDDAEYKYNSDMWKYIKDMVSVRENGTFILDYMGRIAWIGELIADEGLAYGYLLKSIYSEDTEDILLKIYTLAGKMKTYTCAKAISVDGAKRKGTAILTAIDESASTTKSVKDQLIRYSLDKNENIIAIDTSYVNPDRESDKNTLTLYDSGSMVYENQTGRLGTKTIISSSKTLVILVPEDKSDDPSDYAIGYTFIHREKLNIKAYKINRDNGYADVVVVSGSSNPNISTTASIILVAGITITLDDDDEIIWKFEGYQAGSKVEYTITEDIWNKHEIIRETTPGDIVMIAKNSKGEITGLRRYYDYSTDKGELPTDGVCATTENSSISQWNFLSSGYRGETNWYSSAFGDSPQLSFGYVSKKNADGILEWGYNRDGKTDEAIKVKNIMIYDSEQRKEKDRVYVGTIDDVLDYATVGSNCSTVIVQTRDYAFYNGIVVYK